MKLRSVMDAQLRAWKWCGYGAMVIEILVVFFSHGKLLSIYL